MTKNEMIDRMTSILTIWFHKEYKAYHDVSDADSRFRSASEALLGYQEILGMLPPGYLNHVGNNILGWEEE